MNDKSTSDVPPPNLLRLSEVAAILGLHSKTIYHWVRQGKIKAIASPGGMLRMRGEDVRELCKKSGVAVPNRIASIARRVVIASVDEQVVKVAKRSMRGKGFDVVSFQNPYQAFALCIKSPPEFLIIDPEVKSIDLYAMLEAIRTDERCKDIKLIAWGNTDVSKSEQLAAAGFSVLIEKGNVGKLVENM